MLRLATIAIVVMLPCIAQAQTCTITSIHDGDSMHMRCVASHKAIPVRLERIDAPEIQQTGGITSRDYLRRHCPLGHKVTLYASSLDPYGRTLGDVDCGNGNGSVQVIMVRAGHAWVNLPKFSSDRGLVDLQRSARAERLGLWAHPDPLPPWEWRRRQE